MRGDGALVVSIYRVRVRITGYNLMQGPAAMIARCLLMLGLWLHEEKSDDHRCRPLHEIIKQEVLDDNHC